VSGRSRPVAAVVAASLALLAAGCGDDADEPTAVTAPSAAESARLSASERDLVEESEDAIVDYCAQRALGLTDPGEAPTAGQQARALDAVDDLIALAAEKPEARYRPSADVRVFAGDLTENLEGSNCDPLIVGRLQEGLASLPAP
jgi:hypothetical protein